ncbi:MAG: tyrosine-type recombinase/integrase [Holophagales bacterium]|nr:tyrosine-type recombinase/integrase [Holophagales bacterium]
MLEVFYSTGMRRKELSRLLVSDVNAEAGIVRIRHGKGKRSGSSRSARGLWRGSRAMCGTPGPSS